MKLFARYLPAALTSAVLAAGLAGPAQATTYSVSFDTASVAGTSGSVDFQWNLGVIDPSLTAAVFGFSGPAFSTPAVLLYGAASGDLSPGHSVSFAASAPLNYLYQDVTYGSTLSFLLELPDAAPAIGSFASGFSVSLLNSALASALPSTSANGLALEFSLYPGSAPSLETFTAATVSTVSAVPEPSSVALLLVGLVVVAATTRRGSHAGGTGRVS